MKDSFKTVCLVLVVAFGLPISGPGVSMGTNLTDLDDVTISSPTDSQGLKYDTSSSQWVNGKPNAENAEDANTLDGKDSSDFWLNAGFGVQVSNEADFRSNAGSTVPVFVTGSFSLNTTDLTTTCPLYIVPGSRITLNNVTLYENGPHLSTGSYQQYVVDVPNLKWVRFGEGYNTGLEVLASWFGNDHVAAKAAFKSMQWWLDGRVIRFTQGETYTFDDDNVETENNTNATKIIANGAKFTGTYVGPYFRFRNTYASGTKLWVWEGGYFENTSFDGNNLPTTGTRAFEFNDVRVFEVKNVHIKAFDDGIYADNTEAMNIHDNWIQDCNVAIHVPGADRITQNFTVEHNMIGTPDDATRESGILIEQLHRTTRIRDNTFDGYWVHYPIRIFDRYSAQDETFLSPATQIIGNHIEGWADLSGVGKYAIRLEPVSPGSYGFGAPVIKNNTITTPNDIPPNNNGCYGDYATAIYVDGANGGNIDENEIWFGTSLGTNPHQYAVELGSHNSNLMVGGRGHLTNVVPVNGSTALTAAPSPAVPGMIVQADGSGWNPLSSTAPYLTWYDGTNWKGFVPTSHAVNASTYGYGDTTNAGHLRVGTGLSVSTGTVSADFGTTSGKICQGDDSRLSDARTPTAHASSHVSGGDQIANVTTSTHGLMIASDKSKLDGIQTGAINQTTADGRYLQLSTGGTVSGTLTMSGAGVVVPYNYYLYGKDSGGGFVSLIGITTGNLTRIGAAGSIGFYTGTTNMATLSTTSLTVNSKQLTGNAHMADPAALTSAALSGSVGQAGYTLGGTTGGASQYYTTTIATQLNNNDQRLMDQINALETDVASLRTAIIGILSRLESAGINLP